MEVGVPVLLSQKLHLFPDLQFIVHYLSALWVLCYKRKIGPSLQKVMKGINEFRV